MKSNKIAICGLGAGLQAYIKSRPLLAEHPPHGSECPYSWIGLKMRMAVLLRLRLHLRLPVVCCRLTIGQNSHVL